MNAVCSQKKWTCCLRMFKFTNSNYFFFFYRSWILKFRFEAYTLDTNFFIFSWIVA